MKTRKPDTVRRGRPPRSEDQADLGRSRILAAARQLFAEAGYEGVSMRKIASLAECSPAALYTLFPSKRQLLRGIWEEVFADLMVALENTYDQTAPAQRVEALCACFVDFWLQRPDDYRAIFLIEDRLQHAQDSFFVDSSEALRRMAIFSRSLAEAQTRGELRKADPECQQNILLCGIQGIALNLITIPEYPWGDPQQLARNTIRTLLAGLR